jgi:cytochrome oxidase Cu insertion factor (SCO1/SenC/PrrC family)
MALAAIGLFLLAYQWGNQYRHGGGDPPAIGGVLLRPAQPLPDFVLTDSAGEPFGRADLLEHWSLLGIASLGGAGGHRGMARLVEVYNRLADRPRLRARLRLLLVTADAAPGLTRDFERLSPAIAVLTGERPAIADLAAALGADPDTALAVAAGEPPTLFLLDPDARLIALFPRAQEPAAIATDVDALAAHRLRHSEPTDDGPTR